MNENGVALPLSEREVTPELIIDLSSDVVSALKETLGEDELKRIYIEAKADGEDGFLDRFSDLIEKYQDKEAESEPVETNKEDTAQPKSEIVSEVAGKLEELREKYHEDRTTHLSRNMIVCWDKLQLDLEARKDGQPGADGRPVTGGTIAVDVLGIIRGNIFETVIEEVVRGILDTMFPANEDLVDKPEDHEEDVIAVDTTTETDDYGIDFVNQAGVHDNGMVDVDMRGKASDDEASRESNPAYGRYFGFDVSGEPRGQGSLKVWYEGWSERADAVTDGSVRSTLIPQVRLVELYENFYHVSPFGEILNADIHNEKAALSIGDKISQLELRGERAQIFEAVAENRGLTVDELKTEYTDKVMSGLTDRIEKGIAAHGEHLEKTLVPEIKDYIDSYKRDLFTVESRGKAIETELQSLKALPEELQDKEKIQELEDRLEKLIEIKDKLEDGIEKCTERLENIENTLQEYDDLKEILESTENVESKYLAASNVEKNSYGRSDQIEYLSSDVEKEISEHVDSLQDDMKDSIEQYNTDNPDNPIQEREGDYYNRYGISQSGVYDADMDQNKDAAIENADERSKYVEAYSEEGFREYSEYLEMQTEREKELPDFVDESEKEPEVPVVVEEVAETDTEDITVSDVVQVQVEGPEEKEKVEKTFDGDQSVLEDQEDFSVTAADDVDDISSDLAEETGNDTTEDEDEEREVKDFLEDYLADDSFSFSADFLEAYGTPDENAMMEALSEFYLSEGVNSDRLYDLTFEVASYSDEGIMKAVDQLIDNLSEKGLSDTEIVHHLQGMEDTICEGINDLIVIDQNDVEAVSVKIGDTVWNMTPDGIENAVSGDMEDKALTELLAESLNNLLGENIGDTAIDNTVNALTDMGIESVDENMSDFLNQVDTEIQNTIHDLFRDMLPETMRDMLADDLSQMDKMEDPDFESLSDNMPDSFDDFFEGDGDIDL